MVTPSSVVGGYNIQLVGSPTAVSRVSRADLLGFTHLSMLTIVLVTSINHEAKTRRLRKTSFVLQGSTRGLQELTELSCYMEVFKRRQVVVSCKL